MQSSHAQTDTAAKSALLLTPKGAAEALAISPRKLWALTAGGDIPHVRIGRAVRYPVEQLRDWIESHAKGGVQ